MEKRTKGGKGAYCKLEALDEGIVGKREANREFNSHV